MELVNSCPLQFLNVGIYHKIYDIITYLLFVETDIGIHSHAASQYHAWPKAKRGIAMLSVDKLPYPRKQTRGT